jgi:hypothetical protein
VALIARASEKFLAAPALPMMGRTLTLGGDQDCHVVGLLVSYDLSINPHLTRA